MTNIVRSIRFSYFKDTNALVAEASDLKELELERAYPDSADLGFSILSQRTGNTEFFVFDRNEYTGVGTEDQELVAQHFLPTHPKLRAAGLRVVILAD